MRNIRRVAVAVAVSVAVAMTSTIVVHAAQPEPSDPPPPAPDPSPPTPAPPVTPNNNNDAAPPTETKQTPLPPTSNEPPTPVGATPPIQAGPLDLDYRPPLGLFPTTAEDALIDPRMARSWGVAPARWFASTTVDVGFIYARPRLSLGYGKPFTTWAGIDINPVASGNGLGAYGGIRFEAPFIDVRLGSRYFRAFTHTYLDPRSSFDRISLETEADSPAQIITHEAEVDMSFPAGPGNIIGRGSVSYITGVPDGKFVFEETLRIIAQPPFVWRGRAGYALRLGQYGQHSIGWVVDVMDVPKRDDSRTIRTGPVLRVVLSRRVDVRGSFVLTVLSPDHIGLAGSDFTELGVRYRWATE